jgi:3-methyladenine DNA glycosylase Tag
VVYSVQKRLSEVEHIVKNVAPGERPDNDAGYLEMMTKVIFMGGLNRQVVESKWDGFLHAFEDFDVDEVADFTADDIERLSDDERIIRYEAKIRAVVDNAGEMQVIAGESGSFGEWLQQMLGDDGVEATAKELARRFKYLSEQSARRYLYAVGEDVGQLDQDIKSKYGPEA